MLNNYQYRNNIIEMMERMRQEERDQEKRERAENKGHQREIKKGKCEEELYRSHLQAMDELMKMDLNTAHIRDIKEVMSKLDISYVGLYERKELVDKLKANVPKLQTKPGSQQSSCPTQSYR